MAHQPLNLSEKWDFRMLLRIVSEADLDANTMRSLLQLVAALRQQPDRTAVLATTYRHAKGTPFGRLYAHPTGLQGVPGWVRRLCGHTYYHDIDIETCFPSLLRQTAERYGIPCPALAEYASGRQETFARVQRQLGSQELSSSDLKTCFLKMLHRLPQLDERHCGASPGALSG